MTVQELFKSKDFKKSMLDLFNNLAKEVVSNCFGLETDERLLGFFRNFSPVLLEISLHNANDLPIVDVGKGKMPKVSSKNLYKSEKIIMAYHRKFFKQYPELEQDEEAKGKISKFMNALFHNAFESEKLSVVSKDYLADTATKALQDIIYIEDKKPITKTLNRHIEYLKRAKEFTNKWDQPSGDKLAKAIYYKLYLEHGQKKKLQNWLKEMDITSSPIKLMDFLSGENKEVDINPEKLHYIAYLLHRLNGAAPKILELSFGKGVFKHFETYLSHNSRKAGKWTLRELNRQVTDSKYSKTIIKTSVDALVDSLKKS